ncbi:thioesterase family protein [Streptacidiphilus sp. P02-A3a]|uniref:thioesterase family protein n=1 Tax=Streptacidiphilus sp. P02-A3a TaxID=2704468 RepID=UPI0015FC4191|nr:hotdog domain-containing protein [Streptacidiphilus sp. P02-A3a]QMU70563.1 thioesterase [Streptacidiphilus sp. P02-A3a]
MRYEVTEADTASALGSGDVPVLATPRLIAWLEAATVASAAPLLRAASQTTVGTAVRVQHRRPTRVGGWVEVAAEPSATSGDRLTFTVRATDGSGRVVAEGEIDRAVVDREQFLDRAPKPTAE